MPFDKPTEASINRANITKSELESKLDSSPGFSSTLMQIPNKLFKRARSMQSTEIPKRHSTSLSEPRMQRSFLFASRFKQHQNEGIGKQKVSPAPPSPELQAFAQRCDDVIQRTQQLLERTRAQELLIERAIQTHMSMSPAKTPGKKHEHEDTTPSKESWFSKVISPWKGTSPVNGNVIVEGEVTEGVMLPHDTFAFSSSSATTTSLSVEPFSQDFATTRASKVMENNTEVKEDHESSNNNNNNNNNDKSQDRVIRKSSKGRGSRGSGRRSGMTVANETVLQTEDADNKITTNTSVMTDNVADNDANLTWDKSVPLSNNNTNDDNDVDHVLDASETGAEESVTQVCDESVKSVTPKKGWFDWYKEKMFKSPTPSAKNNSNVEEENVDETNELINSEETNESAIENDNNSVDNDASQKNIMESVNTEDDEKNEHHQSVCEISKTGMEVNTKTTSLNEEEKKELTIEKIAIESLTTSPLPTPVPPQEGNDATKESNEHVSSSSLFSRLRSSLQRLASYTSPSKHFHSESTDQFFANNAESDNEEEEEGRVNVKINAHKTRTRNSRTPVRSSRNRSRSSRQSHTANKNRKSVHFVSADKLESVTPARKRVKSEELSNSSASREGSSNSTEDSSKNKEELISANTSKATKNNQSSASSPSTRTSQSRTPARGSIVFPPAPPPSALKSPRLSGFSSARSSIHEHTAVSKQSSSSSSVATAKEKAGKQQQQNNARNKEEQMSTDAKHALHTKSKTNNNKNITQNKLIAKKNAKKASTTQSIKVKGNKVEGKETKHIAHTPTRPSTEHREMIMFIRENSIKKCLSEFTKSDLIHFLRAEGVANPSEELTKKELLTEARALANA